jgi:hypothetical protein
MSDAPVARGVSPHLRPGLCARRMTYSHFGIGLLLLSLSVGGILRQVGSGQAIALLGISVMVTAGVFLHHRAEAAGNKADRFTDRAIAWKKKPAEEESVRGLLEALPKNYFLKDDFATKKGTVDFFLAGPKGILAIDVKSHKGVVTSSGEKLFLDGHPFEKDFIKQAWARSYCVQDLLEEKGICVLRPQPVIVFTDADVRVEGRVGRVYVIGLKDLHAFLERLPVWMSDRLSAAIVDGL